MLVSKIPQPNPIGKTHMCFVCKLDAYMVVFPSGSLLSCVLLYQPPMNIPWTKTIGEPWCIQSWSFHEKYVFQMTMELFGVLIRKQNYYNLVFRNFILPALITYMITLELVFRPGFHLITQYPKHENWMPIFLYEGVTEISNLFYPQKLSGYIVLLVISNSLSSIEKICVKNRNTVQSHPGWL